MQTLSVPMVRSKRAGKSTQKSHMIDKISKTTTDTNASYDAISSWRHGSCGKTCDPDHAPSCHVTLGPSQGESEKRHKGYTIPRSLSS